MKAVEEALSVTPGFKEKYFSVFKNITIKEVKFLGTIP